MTNFDIERAAKALQDLKAMREELDADIATLADLLKAELTRRNAQELEAEDHHIAWTEPTSRRFDASRIKGESADLAAQSTGTITTRRFAVR